jgi:hypothetical protein
MCRGKQKYGTKCREDQRAKAPHRCEFIDIALRAARPIGEGFYCLDTEQTDNGFIVMEVNGNPNIEHGIEDQVGKDEIWTKVLKCVRQAGPAMAAEFGSDMRLMPQLALAGLSSGCGRLKGNTGAYSSFMPGRILFISLGSARRAGIVIS